MERDPDNRTITCKLVYVGPGLAGKSTNLQYIHDHAPNCHANDVVTVDTQGERTIHFELDPEGIEEIQGHRIRFHFYTVPGQSYYAKVRREVLANADGLVFVCDSRREAMDENIESMNDLYDNLRHQQLSDKLPTVIQYNKQDLASALTVDQLNPLLNHRNLPYTRATAASGEGVLETMIQVTSMVIDRLRELPSFEKVPTRTHAAPEPVPSHAPAEQESWLITCYNCDTVLEVPRARTGDIFSCGSCSAPLLIADPDRGITVKPPPPKADRQEQDHLKRDASYGMQALPDPSSSALGKSTEPSGAQILLSGGSFALEGYENVADLDDSLIGHRHRVREVKTGRLQRALILKPTVLRQPGFEAQLEPSLRLANLVRHKGMVPLVGMRRSSGAVAIISQDCPDHQPLTFLLSRREEIKAPQAMGIIRQLALILEEAARHGVVHGWLRPDVVLVGPDGSVMLDELGVPKPHTYLLRESLGSSAATEHYLAPEHMSDNAPSDVRTDMFLLGALLFRMITGQGMITGYSAHEALHKIVSQGGRRMRMVNSSVSRDLDTFCARITAIERKDRCDTYKELIDALDRFGGGARRNTLQVTQGLPASSAQPRRTTGTGASSSPSGEQRRLSSHPRRDSRDSGRKTHGRTTGRTTGKHSHGRLTGVHGRGTTGTRRPTLDAGSSHARHAPKKQGSGFLIALLVLLAIAGGFALYHFHQQSRRPLPRRESNTTTGYDRADERTPPPSDDHSPGPRTTPPSQPEIVRDDADSPPDTGGDHIQSLIAEARRTHDAYLANKGDRELYAQARAAITAVLNASPDHGQRKMVMALHDNLTHNAPSDVPPPRPVEPDATTSAVSEQVSRRFEELLARERFSEAERLLADAVDVPNARAPLQHRLEKVHDDLFAKLNRVLDRSVSLEEAKRVLRGPLEVWGYEDDRKFAEALLKSKRELIDQLADDTGGPVVDGSLTAPETATAETDRTPGGFLVSIIRKDIALDQALLATERFKVDDILKNLPATAPETRVMTHKVQVWRQRDDILATAFAARSPKLRLTPPIDEIAWDVVGITADYLRIRNPSGSEMDLQWHKVKPQELGAMFALAASGEGVLPIEHAAAAVINTMVEEIGPAEAHAARAAAADYEHAPLLETLIAMWRARDLVRLGDRAQAAIASNDTPGLQAVIDELTKPRFMRHDEVPAMVERYRTILADLRSGKIMGGRSLRDVVAFDAIDDLDAFPTTSGTWVIQDGSVRNTTDGVLARGDCGNARSLTVRFQTLSDIGGFTIGFRGVRLVVDLAGRSFHLLSPGERLADRSFPFVQNMVHTVHLALEADDRVRCEINQADPIRLSPGSLTARVAIATDTGARLAVEDMRIRRMSIDTAAISDEDREVLRTALGLHPFGMAYKDPTTPAIILPRSAESRSGIGIPIKDTTSGINFVLRGGGEGDILLGMATVEDGRPLGELSKVDLPAAGEPPLAVKVSWDAKNLTMVLTQKGAEPAHVRTPMPADPSHFVIIATGRAMIMSTPVIERL